MELKDKTNKINDENAEKINGGYGFHSIPSPIKDGDEYISPCHSKQKLVSFIDYDDYIDYGLQKYRCPECNKKFRILPGLDVWVEYTD